jgi:hypothetical protein
MATPRSVSSLAALAALFATGAARADAAQKIPDPAPESTPSAPDRSWETAPASRRSGFVAGIAIGGGVASIGGYPNDAKKVGQEKYYATTGASPLASGYAWIGGALADWFTFGLGATSGRLIVKDREASTVAFLFHIEAYPLFPLGGAWRDLGVTVNAGAGPVSFKEKGEGGATLAEAGFASLFGAGVFYEGLRFWKFATGPSIAGEHMFAGSANRPALFVGWRLAVYTGKNGDR